MSMEEVERFLNNFLLALQLALGVWQFMKLTPIGALIQGVIGAYLLRPFRLSKTYGRLPGYYDGRVFKRVDCYVLQPDIPSERTIVMNEVDTIHLSYCAKVTILERRGSEKNMLLIDNKMRYYISPTVWVELKTLEHVLHLGLNFNPYATGAAADDDYRDALRSYATSLAHEAAYGAAYGATIPLAAAAVTADIGAGRRPAFVKGRRDFWEEVITGGVMELEEVLDRIILDNQCVSSRLSDDWLLPVNLSVSEEKLLKILNLFGLFLQTRKTKVHWLFPTSLSLVSALLEFTTKLRVWLYSKINVVFCFIVQFICDLMPWSWRRQVYSLGKYVENVRPGNDIDLKIKRGTVCAIIAGAAKVEREDATLVPWLNVADEHNEVIEKRFRCEPNDIEIMCKYYVRVNMCKISAPKISVFHVGCGSKTEFEQIITLVSCIAEKRCGSLKSYGPKRKVCVRGFKESVISYVKNGRPPIYELVLDDVVVT